ncbi:MAG: TatD family hydrolase [Muribaculaceae bacterium]|nr:TatD family hydrolase [Muribaculaceae bacterium]
MIDTHTHLYLPEFDSDRDATMLRATEAGIGMMILPNVDLSTIEPMKALHKAYPSCTAMAMGLHPTEIDGEWRQHLDRIEAELKSEERYIAVGEVGIDLYWDKQYRYEQTEALDAQMDMALDAGLPMIIHCREGLDTILDLLRSRHGRIPELVFHSFGGTTDDICAIRRLCDPMFGINGIVTFKNSHLHETLPSIGLEHILLETDAPYLAPVPCRGKRNESSYIRFTAARIADIFKTTADNIADITTRNAQTFFGLTDH